jgi:hypothetical protein
LNHAEKAAVEGGRELIRHSLEGIVQEAVHEVEKKRNREPVRNAKRNGNTSATVKKTSKPPPGQ